MKKYLKLSILFFCLQPFGLNAWLASDIKELIKGREDLLERSSRDFFTVEEGKYIVFSHGYSSLECGFERSITAVKLDSLRQMAKLVGTTELSGNSSFDHSSKGDMAIEKIFDRNRIDTSVFVRNAQTRGYWVDDDGFHIVSCVYLNIAPSQEKFDLSEEFYDIDLSKDGLEMLENNRDIWLGGAKIIYNPKDNNNYLIVMVSVDEALPVYKQQDKFDLLVMSEATTYLKGVDFKSKSVITKEMQSISIGGEEEVEISERFYDINISKVQGLLKSLKQVGTLKHKTYKRKFALYIKNLKDL